MGLLWQDIRYGARMLAKNRSFTFVAVFTLALGIGANSAIFSVINSVLLKPFSFREPERLVVAWERCLDQGLTRMVVSPPNFADWRAQLSVFEDMAAYRAQDFNLTLDAEPELVRGLCVSATMFSMLGVQPVLGRDFQADEDQPGMPASVIISHGFWQRHFSSDPNVIGQSIALGNQSATIIGVMPPDFDFPPPIAFRGEARAVKIEMWTQLRYTLEMNQRGAHNLFVLGRLKTGVSLAQAEAELQTVAERLANDFPQTNKNWDVFLVPLHEQVFGDVKTALMTLPAAVAFVLLIACANVANLLLVKATARQREMAIRAALGARRRNLIGQVLVDSTLLSLLGGILGLAFAACVLRLIALLAPPNIYRMESVSLDSRVVVFTLLVSLLTALIFGIVPSLQTSRIDLVTSLKEGSAAAAGSASGSNFRNLLVVGEITLSLILLTGAGLLIRSLIRLQSVPTGFQPEHLIAMNITLPRATYPDRQSRLAFTERLMPKLIALPEVQSAAFSHNLPLDAGLQGTEFKVEGQPVDPGREPHTYVSIISPDYFRTMGTQLLQGREFVASDKLDAPGVVVISRFLAERFFPNQDPIGKRIDMGFRTGTPLQIVGVAADTRPDALQSELHPTMYLPYAQAASTLPLFVLLRSANDPASVTSGVREQVREIDSKLPVYDVKTMNQVMSTAMARPRFTTFLLAAFSGLAVLLAAVGIYGVMSYTVAQSTREIGIRMALGAQSGDLFKLIIGQGLLLTLLGVGIGVAGAWALTHLIASLLFGVTATDTLTFIGVPLLVIAVTLLACYFPARRAMRVDPMIALRYE